jgi:hypothetical protein
MHNVSDLYLLTFEQHIFAYANTCKAPLETRFIYLDNKETYRIFKACCIISVEFSTKCHLFHNFVFSCSKNTFSLNHMLKFKYHPCCFVYSVAASIKTDVELALKNASSQLSVGSTQSTGDGHEAFCIPVPTYGENERFAYASAALDLR